MTSEIEKRKPQPIDYENAELGNPEWANLPTRKRNALAKQEMFSREYSQLCDAIKNFRYTGPVKEDELPRFELGQIWATSKRRTVLGKPDLAVVKKIWTKTYADGRSAVRLTFLRVSGTITWDGIDYLPEDDWDACSFVKLYQHLFWEPEVQEDPDEWCPK